MLFPPTRINFAADLKFNPILKNEKIMKTSDFRKKITATQPQRGLSDGNITNVAESLISSKRVQLSVTESFRYLSVSADNRNGPRIHSSDRVSSSSISSIVGSADATSLKSFSVSYWAIPIGWVIPLRANSAFLLLLLRQSNRPIVGLSSGAFTYSSTAEI